MGGSPGSDSSDDERRNENGRKSDSSVDENLREDAVPYDRKHKLKHKKCGHKSYDSDDDSDSTRSREPVVVRHKPKKSYDADASPAPRFSAISIVGSSNVHLGNNVMVVKERSVTDSSPKTPVCIEKTADVVAVLQSEKQVSDALLTDLSHKFGEGWKGVFRKMGIKECAISNAYETYFCHGVPEIIYQLLYDWRNAEDRKLGNLCSALWEAERQDLVQEIIDLYKAKCYI